MHGWVKMWKTVENAVDSGVLRTKSVENYVDNVDEWGKPYIAYAHATR